MYEHLFHYFGLRENPFHVSPDPRFYFATRVHDAALAELVFGIDTRQGIIVLTGESGTGKTTVLNHFLNWLHERKQSSSYVFHSQLKPAELFEFILRDFGVPYQSRDKGDLLGTLHQWLIQRHALGDAPVLIIDEAQAISRRTLDQLRLLLNLEAPGGKLLQMILSGQPELEEKLRRPELRQLQQRVMFRCRLQPLSMEETSRYVRSRLASAGATNLGVFAQESLEALHMYARGIPRTINLLCEHALIAGYAEEAMVISPEVIRRVATDFDLAWQPAADQERELTSRFGRLLAFRTEEKPLHVTPENIAAEVEKSETIVQEPRQAGEAEPVLIVEEKISLVPEPVVQANHPAATAVNHPIAATVAAPHEVVTLVAKPMQKPRPAPPKQLPVGWQRPGFGTRFVQYWKDVKYSFVRDWKQFLGAHGLAGAVAANSSVSSLQKNVIVPTVKWLRAPASSATSGGKARPANVAARKR
jgi:general secretion pathway protein A